MKNKRGLERGIVISIILIAITLGILLAFFIISHLNEAPSEAACHQAVVYRGSLYEATKAGSAIKDIIVKDAINMISLKCKQKNIVVETDDKEKIMGIISDELARCWSMLGEGKVNFFGHTLEEKQQCMICSKISFSDSLREKAEIKIEPKDLEYFFITTLMPGKEITYADYFAGAKERLKYSAYDAQNDSSISQEAQSKLDDVLKANNVNMNTISTKSSEGYAVVYTLWSKSNFEKALADLGIDIGAGVSTLTACWGISALLAIPTGGASLAFGAVCTVAVGIGAAYVASEAKGAVASNWQEGAYIGGMTLVPYNPQGLISSGNAAKGIQCTSFESIQD